MSSRALRGRACRLLSLFSPACWDVSRLLHHFTSFASPITTLERCAQRARSREHRIRSCLRALSTVSSQLSPKGYLHSPLHSLSGFPVIFGLPRLATVLLRHSASSRAAASEGSSSLRLLSFILSAHQFKFELHLAFPLAFGSALRFFFAARQWEGGAMRLGMCCNPATSGGARGSS
jgi:hypothetical protein